MRIVFLLPHPVAGATGGYKVVLEYANRLVAIGHQVDVVYSGSLFWRQKTWFYKLTNVARYVQHLWRGYGCGRWTKVDPRVKERLTLSLNQRHVPKADAYICTSPYTAMYLNAYDTTARRYYLIQGYERWGAVTDAMLRQTYHYPFERIVVSSWLQRLLREEEGLSATLIPNGFDTERFYLSTPIASKAPLRITMNYSPIALKDLAMGFEALRRVHEVFPEVRVNLFGAFPKPEGLESWYDYYQSPDADTHRRLYDEAAIFVATSRSEGWGLTVGEAMLCGQAVCCTDNDGYKEMATHGETALLSPVGDAEALAHNIITLIRQADLRQRLATQAHANIQQFTWESAFEQLCSVLGA